MRAVFTNRSTHSPNAPLEIDSISWFQRDFTDKVNALWERGDWNWIVKGPQMAERSNCMISVAFTQEFQLLLQLAMDCAGIVRV